MADSWVETRQGWSLHRKLRPPRCPPTLMWQPPGTMLRILGQRAQRQLVGLETRTDPGHARVLAPKTTVRPPCSMTPPPWYLLLAQPMQRWPNAQTPTPGALDPPPHGRRRDELLGEGRSARRHHHHVPQHVAGRLRGAAHMRLEGHLRLMPSLWGPPHRCRPVARRPPPLRTNTVNIWILAADDARFRSHRRRRLTSPFTRSMTTTP